MGHADYWKDVHRAFSEDARRLREQAANDYPLAFELARRLAPGLTLVRNSNAHYALVGPGWRIEVYPGNRRLYRASGHGSAPFLSLPKDWSLLDLVRVAAAAVNESSPVNAGSVDSESESDSISG